MSKKILFVLPSFLPETFGGAEQQTLKINIELNKKKITTKILTSSFSNKTQLKNTISGVKVERFKLKNYPNLGGKYFFSFLLWSIKIFFWSIQNIKNYDIIYVIHARLHCLPLILISKIFKKKLIIKIGIGGDNLDLKILKQKKLLGNFYYYFAKNYVDYWIAISSSIYKNLLKINIPKKKIFKIYNGVNIQYKEKKYLPGIKKFLYCGRFDKEKNIEQIIRVFSFLQDRKSFKLTLVGDGTEKKKIKKLINFYNLNKQVSIKNKTNNLTKYFIKNHFFISSSCFEGMSNSLLEASSFGLPSISSNVSGAPDIINNNVNGFLFSVNNDIEFYDKIMLAIKMNKKKYMEFSNKILNHVNNNFSFDIILKKQLKLFDNL